MKEIKCPYDLNQFLLGEPIFENPFPEEECKQRKFYGDCYHCFATAIASRDHQLLKKEQSLSVIKDIKSEIMSYRNSVDRAISEDEFKRDGMKIAYQDCIEIIDEYMAMWKERHE